MSTLETIRERIEKLRNDLNHCVIYGCGWDKLYALSVLLDKEINKYIQYEQLNKN